MFKVGDKIRRASMDLPSMVCIGDIKTVTRVSDEGLYYIDDEGDEVLNRYGADFELVNLPLVTTRPQVGGSCDYFEIEDVGDDYVCLDHVATILTKKELLDFADKLKEVADAM